MCRRAIREEGELPQRAQEKLAWAIAPITVFHLKLYVLLYYGDSVPHLSLRTSAHAGKQGSRRTLPARRVGVAIRPPEAVTNCRP